MDIKNLRASTNYCVVILIHILDSDQSEEAIDSTMMCFFFVFSGYIHDKYP